jgi:hypothetical protein
LTKTGGEERGTRVGDLVGLGESTELFILWVHLGFGCTHDGLFAGIGAAASSVFGNEAGVGGVGAAASTADALGGLNP